MSFTFMGFFPPMDGYGYAGLQIVRELQHIDAGITVLNMDGMSDDPYDDKRHWSINGTAVALCTPDWLAQIGADRLVSYTMFETTKLPAGWVEKLNKNAQLCLVPCQWCKEVFMANGVTIPIEVAKWGINPQDYYPLQREHAGKPYTFLWSGTADRRKGWDVAYSAFIKAFGHDMRARLILHFRDPLPVVLKFDDPNVRAVIGYFDRPILREMLREADCFVFPSRGEGWGSPPREAAATGLPVLVTDYGGTAEEMIHWGLPINVCGMSVAEYGWWSDIGEWAEPDVDHLAGWMNWCVENPEAARDFGAGAARWLEIHATWSRTARGIIDKVKG